MSHSAVITANLEHLPVLLSPLQQLLQNKTKSKVFSLERLYKFCIKNFQKKFQVRKKFCPKIFFKETLCSEKFWFKKKFCLKKFWSEKFLAQNFFGTNKVVGLKILGPKKFRIWKKNWGLKKIWKKKKFQAKINFGLGKFF